MLSLILHPIIGGLSVCVLGHASSASTDALERRPPS